jgi:hypothetical protein
MPETDLVITRADGRFQSRLRTGKLHVYYLKVLSLVAVCSSVTLDVQYNKKNSRQLNTAPPETTIPNSSDHLPHRFWSYLYASSTSNGAQTRLTTRRETQQQNKQEWRHCNHTDNGSNGKTTFIQEPLLCRNPSSIYLIRVFRWHDNSL